MRQYEKLIEIGKNGTAIDYPDYCKIFLKNSKPLDEQIRSDRYASILNRMDYSGVFECLFMLSASAARNSKFSVLKTAFNLAEKALLTTGMKQACQQELDTLILKIADRRAEFLSTADRWDDIDISSTLPDALRTEQAASYMYLRRCYHMGHVIGASLR